MVAADWADGDGRDLMEEAECELSLESKVDLGLGGGKVYLVG